MKLYLRTTLAVFAALLVAFSIMLLLKLTVVDPKWRSDLARLAEPEFLFIKEAIDKLPPHERLERVDQLNQEYDLQTRVIQGDEAARLRKSKPEDSIVWPVELDGQWFFAADFGEPQLIASGPLLHPKPSGWIQFFGLFLGLVAAATAAAFVVRPVTRRVRGLRDATQELSKGNMEARAQVGADDVIGQLERNFNGMANKIDGLLQNKRELLQAVSHELRTPIAKLRFANELMQDATDSESRARYGGTIESSLDELDALVDELLTYARFDDNSPDLEREEVHLNALCVELQREAEELGVETELSFDVEVSGLWANKYYLRRAIKNGLGNAIRYASSRVELHASVTDGDVVIHIDDDGPGVPRDQRERVFEAFARTDDSRCRNSGGAGLGLSIVARIMRWHHGSAHMDESSLGGARLVLRLPLRPTPTA